MNQKITLFLCIMFLYSVCLLHAQIAPVIQWNNAIGGAGEDICSEIIQTRDGGYLIAGASEAGVGYDKSEPNRGYAKTKDIWILKIDAYGVKEWDKTYGGNSDDGYNFSSLQQTTDGGYILGGTSYSGVSGDKSKEDYPGTADYWIIKIDSNGVKQWDESFGGSDQDFLYCFQQTLDGGYILGGESRSPKGGDRTHANKGFYDWWVVKLDSNGVKQWDRTFGDIDNDRLYSIQQTKDGGYILGGSVGGVSGYLLVKLNINGAEQWNKSFSSGNLKVVQQTIDGGYILAGDSFLEAIIGGDKTDTSRGATDYWIVKTDLYGVKQWDKTFGGSQYEFCASLQQTADGGYLIGGYTNSPLSGDFTEESRGYNDYWMVKIDAKGIKQWDKRLGGSSDDYLGSVKQTTDGGYIVAGTSISRRSGDKSDAGPGQENYWVIKLCYLPQTRITRSGTLDLCLSGSVTLSALQVQGGQYQWFKNTVAIPGATATNYTATEVGKYKYTVTVPGGCTASSVTLTISNSCARTKNIIAASPNPSSGVLSVSYNSTINEQVNIYVFNKAGLPVFNGVQHVTKGSNSFILNLSGLINGAYTLQVNGNKTQTRMNLIIQK